MKDNDANLVQSVLSGNLDDFRELVDKYQLLAEQWAFHHVRNMFEAEEIVQEAFVEAYFRLNTLHEPHKFGGWLRRIVTNMAVSWLRRRKSTVPFEEISGIYSDTNLYERYNRYEVPHDLLEQQEREELLHAAIDLLPPAYQRVITMFYFDDRSYKEIAAHQEVSVAAVKSMLYRARQQLKKEVQEMSRGKIDRRIEVTGEFGEQVMQEIGSLREELVTIRQLLERTDAAEVSPTSTLQRAAQEYRRLPSGDRNAIRWGFMGAWGAAGPQGAAHLGYSIMTTTQEDFFDTPRASDENVAAFAAAFTNPNTIGICKYLFRNDYPYRNDKKATRAEIKQGCNLNDEELDAALKPLLEWSLVEWKDDKLEIGPHGVNWAVTLIGMTKQASYQRETNGEQK